MFKISDNCWINPAHVAAITIKRPGKDVIIFAITLVGNVYCPTKQFKNSKEASEFLKELKSEVYDARS